MILTIEWRGTVSATLRDNFEEGVKRSLNSFFKRFPEPINEIKLVAFRPATGPANGRLIRPASPTADFGHMPVGYRAMITIDGSKTQGLVCLMMIDKKSVEEVTDIIESGPYFKKRQALKNPDANENVVDHDGGEDSNETTVHTNEDVAVRNETATSEVAINQTARNQIAPASNILEELSDVELLQHVAQILKKRKEVSANLADVSLREKTLTDEVHALEHDLAIKRGELAIVSAQVEADTSRLSEFSIPEPLKQQALAAKARLDDSFGDLLKV